MADESDRLYRLTFEERPEYLYACIVSKTVDREMALEYLSLVAQKCSELRTRRLMLHRDIPVMLPDSDLFFTTKDFLEMIGGTRTAFVNPHQKIAEGMEFAITIGNNRGANYRVFDNDTAAEDWLIGPAAKPPTGL